VQLNLRIEAIRTMRQTLPCADGLRREADAAFFLLTLSRRFYEAAGCVNTHCEVRAALM